MSTEPFFGRIKAPIWRAPRESREYELYGVRWHCQRCGIAFPYRPARRRFLYCPSCEHYLKVHSPEEGPSAIVIPTSKPAKPHPKPLSAFHLPGKWSG
jgi:hypothetical protein